MALDQTLYRALVQDGLPPKAARRLAGVLGSLGQTAASTGDEALNSGASGAGLPAPFAPGNGNAWGFGADSYNGYTMTDSNGPFVPMDEALTFDDGSWSTGLVDNAYMHWDPTNPGVFTVKQAGWYTAYVGLSLASATDFNLNIGIDFTPHGSHPAQDGTWDYDIPAGGGKNANVYVPLYLSAGAVIGLALHISPFGMFESSTGKSAVVSYAALFLTPLFALDGVPV